MGEFLECILGGPLRQCGKRYRARYCPGPPTMWKKIQSERLPIAESSQTVLLLWSDKHIKILPIAESSQDGPVCPSVRLVNCQFEFFIWNARIWEDPAKIFVDLKVSNLKFLKGASVDTK